MTLYDTLKINGKKYYAMGEFENSAKGYKYAKQTAQEIRSKGISARIVKRKSGYQVYSTSKDAATPQQLLKIMKETKARREFTDKRGRHWFDDGFEVWQDNYSGDDESFNDRDTRYIDDW